MTAALGTTGAMPLAPIHAPSVSPAGRALVQSEGSSNGVQEEGSPSKGNGSGLDVRDPRSAIGPMGKRWEKGRDKRRNRYPPITDNRRFTWHQAPNTGKKKNLDREYLIERGCPWAKESQWRGRGATGENANKGERIANTGEGLRERGCPWAKESPTRAAGEGLSHRTDIREGTMATGDKREVWLQTGRYQ